MKARYSSKTTLFTLTLTNKEAHQLRALALEVDDAFVHEDANAFAKDLHETVAAVTDPVSIDFDYGSMLDQFTRKKR